MKTIYRTIKCLLLAVFMLLINSCDSFVDVELPNSQLTNVAVFDNMTTANAAMAGLYSNLRDASILRGGSGGISYYLGLYTDELDYYQQSPTNQFYTNTLVASEAEVLDIWNQTYKHIYAANAIIEGTANSTNLSETGRKQLRGECLFIRGILHLNLLNVFGDIPYITRTDYLENSKVKRVSENVVYDAIIADLKEASNLLPEAYPTNERVRPNRAAALAILARAYLYHKQYADALNSASAVITNPLYVWENDLTKTFLKGSTSTIWQFMPNSNTNYTPESEAILTSRPSLVALTPEFINAFETGDRRKISWIGSVTVGTETWYYNYKYKHNPAVGGNTTEYSIILRLAEQYLIRAEAKLMSGDLDGARDDLNVIRHTAGLNNTSALTVEELLTEIIRQRRFELFTEFGQRFFDLKRTGRLDSELKPKKQGWDSNDRLWPIPQKEILANPNLNPQNPGY